MQCLSKSTLPSHFYYISKQNHFYPPWNKMLLIVEDTRPQERIVFTLFRIINSFYTEPGRLKSSVSFVPSYSQRTAINWSQSGLFLNKIWYIYIHIKLYFHQAWKVFWNIIYIPYISHVYWPSMTNAYFPNTHVSISINYGLKEFWRYNPTHAQTVTLVQLAWVRSRGLQNQTTKTKLDSYWFWFIRANNKSLKIPRFSSSIKSHFFV